MLGLFTRPSKLTSNKFIGTVQEIFKNLPKPVKWLSFYLNDLPLLMDFCEEVRDAYLEHHLNKLKLPAASFGECARFCGSKVISQIEIDHIIIFELAQAGIFGAVESHISRGNLPVVADLVFCEYLCGRPVMACVAHPSKSSG